MHLFPVRGTHVVHAMTGDSMVESADAGLRWQRLGWPTAVVSFVTPRWGWRLGPATTLRRPPQLLETRDAGRSWTARVNPCADDYGLTAGLSFTSPTAPNLPYGTTSNTSPRSNK
jgi:photosystem II stability/assembly factor-like uncharacterized protein